MPIEFNPALDEPSFNRDEDTQGYDLSRPGWAVCIFDRIDGTHEGHPRPWEWLRTKDEAIDYAKALVSALVKQHGAYRRAASTRSWPCRVRK